MEAEVRSRPAMQVKNLYFSYGKNRVLKGVDLSIEEGKVTTILGANGCGKSTLFLLMTKSLTPSKGKILLRGRSIGGMGLREFARQVAIVQQYNTASDDVTVEQLVSYGRTPHRRMMRSATEEDGRLVEWAMEVTGIARYRDREVSRLSGGQRQRVWIAMALAQDTKLLFLDEPTTYLDIRYQIEILELVRKLNREIGITIVMVLHDINQAIHYSDTVIGMKDGRVTLCGRPEEVVDTESLRTIYDISLEVAAVDGRRFVLLRQRQEEGGEAAADKTETNSRRLCEDGGGTGGAVENIKQDVRENGKEKKRSRFRVLWVLLGIICLGLGSIGVVLPILPTVPFYLVTAFAFAKSSQRLHSWFVSTGLYRKNLQDFVEKKGMTMAAKLRICGTVTVVMAVGFAVMFFRGVTIGCISVSVVWVCHILYFFGRVRTIKGREEEKV